MPAYRIEELCVLVRFAEIVIHTQLDSARTVFVPHTRRDHDDWNIRDARIIAHVRGKFVAIHARHLDVEKDDIGFVVLYHADRIESVLGGFNTQTAAVQETLGNAADGNRIIDDQRERAIIGRRWRCFLEFDHGRARSNQRMNIENQDDATIAENRCARHAANARQLRSNSLDDNFAARQHLVD